ncbi:MAG TPA: prephenate dehydrogenase/arogenate dehydrogenase family protein [Methylomirabilota bacterium]|jgi:prephenate dehydrogenase|nr:prephenate dehydrogenase/arogenate dehydrogenase family protein [Methylomirabilota bacterium]
MAVRFRRVAVLGTGLVGGSFALALRKLRPRPRVIGWDKPEVLREARKRRAIDRAEPDLARAVAGADLIYVALPVGATLELLPQIARAAAAKALVTDSASSKRAICARASECFQKRALFLGGHPMAGKELSGIAAADAGLFRRARYALIRRAGSAAEEKVDPRVDAFAALVRKLGAEPVWLDADSHDRGAAIVSHLPQLLSVALAGVVRNATDSSGLPLTLAGRGLRDALRLAGSPYSLWRDIILTNTDNIDRALDRMEQAIENLRAVLRGRELEDEFAAAAELYEILRDLQ